MNDEVPEVMQLPFEIQRQKRINTHGFSDADFSQMAKNIVYIANKFHANEWRPFSFKEYKDRCDHDVDDFEEATLKRMLQAGYLRHVQMRHNYMVTEKFIAVVTDIHQQN